MTRVAPNRLAAPRALLVAAVLIGVASPGLAQTSPPAETANPPSAAAPATPTDASAPAASAPAVPVQTPAAGAPPAEPQPSGTPASSPPSDVAAPATPAAAMSHDMSPWAMFKNADVVVKSVMLLLAAASLVTWTIFIAKRLQLATARYKAVRGVREVLRGGSLRDLDRARNEGKLKGGPVAALVHAAAHERERSANLPVEGVKERAAISLQRIEARAARTMTRGTGLVASIGSTAPFVGLFGTVWGIMNSFVGISQAHTTNLAVVAPGIAEALMATAIGLVAAIPAVIIYNGLARATAGYKAILSDASAEIMRHLSRDLDRQFTPAE